MTTQLIFPPTKKERNEIGSLVVEATISENYNESASLSNYTIEDGSTISDHVYVSPSTYSLSGVISDDPIEETQGLNGLTDRRIEAYDVLKKLLKEKTVITLVCGLTVLTDMVMTSFTSNRTSETGKSIDFSCDFQQIKKAVIKRTQNTKSKINKEKIKIASPKVKKGKVNSSSVSSSKSKKVSAAVILTSGV